MGVRFHILVAVCLQMASPAAASTLQMHSFPMVSCPDSVLNALATQVSLDHEIARSELLPALRKMVLGGQGKGSKRWGHWPISTVRKEAMREAALRERSVVRLNGIVHDLTEGDLNTMVLPITSQGQPFVLDQLDRLDPDNLPPVPMPRWRLRGRHVMSGLQAGVLAFAATSFCLDWRVELDSLFAGSVGLMWMLGRSHVELELAQQQACRIGQGSPENTTFFLGLRDHRDLITQPTERGDWAFSSINFEQNAQPLYVDLFTHVGQSESDLQSVTWLILRRP